jgi:hypothetical protein
MNTNLNFWENTILNNINLEGYNLPDNLTDLQKLDNIYDIFSREYMHANNIHLGINELFCEWLQGLPNCLSVPYMNYEILKNAKKYGAFNLVTERDKNIFLDNYFPMLAKSFFTLKNKLSIELN